MPTDVIIHYFCISNRCIHVPAKKIFNKKLTSLFCAVDQSSFHQSSMGSSNTYTKVQVGKDQEKAQSEKDFHSKNQGGKNQTNKGVAL